MIQIVDAGLLECHILKELCVLIPSHAVIWLGLMPLSPPFVAARSTSPLFPVVNLVIGRISLLLQRSMQ
jgi:hypothetical protein